MLYFAFDLSGELVYSASQLPGFVLNRKCCYYKEMDLNEDFFRLLMMDISHFAAFIVKPHGTTKKYKLFVLTEFTDTLEGFQASQVSSFFESIRKYGMHLHRVRFTSNEWEGLCLSDVINSTKEISRGGSSAMIKEIKANSPKD